MQKPMVPVVGFSFIAVIVLFEYKILPYINQSLPLFPVFVWYLETWTIVWILITSKLPGVSLQIMYEQQWMQYF